MTTTQAIAPPTSWEDIKKTLFLITDLQTNYFQKARNLIQPDLSVQQWQILLVIAGRPGLNAKDIKEALDMTGGSLTRNTKTLGKYFIQHKDGTEEEKGLNLIYSVRGKFNQRSFEYYLTPKGEKVIQQLLTNHMEMIKTLLTKFHSN